MGPEELAIITNPRFIQGCFNAGESWANGIMGHLKAIATERNYIEANNKLANLNSSLLEKLRQERETLRNRSETYLSRINELERTLSQERLQNQDDALESIREMGGLRREGNAIEAAGLTVMSTMAQAMESWAAQGKAPMLDNRMLSHTMADGKPMTMRKYMWYAALIREMVAHKVPPNLIRERCPVAEIETFLDREAEVSEEKME